MAAKKTTAAKKTAAKRTTAPQSTDNASPRTPRAGSVVTIKSDVDNAPASYGLVVGTVTKTEHRDAGVYVVPLPDAVHIGADQVENV
jgi:hypothetical protein